MLKVLCAADVHIGRTASRMPAAASYTAARAWLNLVDLAIREQVHAVLLAGDLVDEQSRFFEASGPVEQGVASLRDAGIAIVAVSGNHDHDVLHRIAHEVGGGHLVVLGRGGKWERHTLRNAAGQPVLHVDGWSFPEARHGSSPLDSYRPEPPGDGVPLVGLLHCDLDSSVPHYAPVPLAALTGTSHAAWVLGHVHAPALKQAPGSTPVLYPGSPLAFDPGEPGVHGAWVLELAGEAPSVFRQVPLSPVRYETVDVDLSDAEEDDDAASAIVSAVSAKLEATVAESDGLLEILVCRLRLQGRTPLHGSLDRIVRNAEDLEPHRGDARAVVDPRYVIDTLPALDLEGLSRGQDAAAKLAQLLMALDDREAVLDDALMHAVRRAAAEVSGRPHYLELGHAAPAGETNHADSAIRELLRRQAALLLDEIMGQKEAV
jgi:DNA repair protein SbcD/Mre11